MYVCGECRCVCCVYMMYVYGVDCVQCIYGMCVYIMCVVCGVCMCMVCIWVYGLWCMPVVYSRECESVHICAHVRGDQNRT